jgi:hypothetical protein
MQANPDVQDVIENKLRLLDPAVRQSHDTAAELLDPDFREFGVSVRVGIGVRARHAGHGRRGTATDFTATTLADGVVLLTYRSRRGRRAAIRNSCGGGATADRGGSSSTRGRSSRKAD